MSELPPPKSSATANEKDQEASAPGCSFFFFLLIVKHDTSQESQLMSMMSDGFYICFSAEETFKRVNVSEISCPWPSPL